MKKKILFIVSILCILLLFGCGKKETKVIYCEDFKENKYTIHFNSNGGTEYKSVDICGDCERDENNLLPQPTKKGFTFGGWYYDDLFLSKADVKTIDELEVFIAKDNKGCDSSYKDVNLYALWIKK